MARPCDCPLELLVDGLGPADESDRGQAISPLIERLVRRLDHLGMGRKSEVIVGAEVDDLDAVDLDRRRLWALYDPLFLVEAGLANGGELGGQKVAKRVFHGVSRARVTSRAQR